MKKHIISIITALLLCSGCGTSAPDETTTVTTAVTTEKVTTTKLESATEKITETVTTENTTAVETTTQDIKETLIEADRILEAYTYYADDVGTGNFEACVGLIQARFGGNEYSIVITEPTEEVLGTIKVIHSGGKSLYIGFYPHPRLEQEVITTVEYSLNENVSISTTNDMNFNVGAPKKYNTRDVNRNEVTQTASGIDEQIEFLANFQ